MLDVFENLSAAIRLELLAGFSSCFFSIIIYCSTLTMRKGAELHVQARSTPRRSTFSALFEGRHFPTGFNWRLTIFICILRESVIEAYQNHMIKWISVRRLPRSLFDRISFIVYVNDTKRIVTSVLMDISFRSFLRLLCLFCSAIF